MVAITSVLLPLYIYPTLGPASWNAIYTSIAANPDLDFNIVVNPDSGPGGAALPDDNYKAAIAQLNTYENTNLLGYVHTSYGTETIAAVKANITKYDDWVDYTTADITLAGIFFDEAVSQYTAADYTYLQTLSAFARSSGFETIILNPGAIPDSRYYALADQILAFENAASAYIDAVDGWVDPAQWAKTAFMMYGFTGSAADQTALVAKLKAKGLGGLFISDLGVYDRVSGLWAQFTAALAA